MELLQLLQDLINNAKKIIELAVKSSVASNEDYYVAIQKTGTEAERINLRNLPVSDAVLDLIQGFTWQQLTGNYTLTISDVGKIFYYTGGTDIIVTIPNNSSVAYGRDIKNYFIHEGAGKIIINYAAGVTGVQVRTKLMNQLFCLNRRGVNNWVATGDFDKVSLTANEYVVNRVVSNASNDIIIILAGTYNSGDADRIESYKQTTISTFL